MRKCFVSCMLLILKRLVLCRHCAAAAAGTAARVAAVSGAVSASANVVYMLPLLSMKVCAGGAEVFAVAGAGPRSQLTDHDAASLAEARSQHQHRLHLRQHGHGRAAFGTAAVAVVEVPWAETTVAAVARRKSKIGS